MTLCLGLSLEPSCAWLSMQQTLCWHRVLSSTPLRHCLHPFHTRYHQYPCCRYILHTTSFYHNRRNNCHHFTLFILLPTLNRNTSQSFTHIYLPPVISSRPSMYVLHTSTNTGNPLVHACLSPIHAYLYFIQSYVSVTFLHTSHVPLHTRIRPIPSHPCNAVIRTYYPNTHSPSP